MAMRMMVGVVDVNYIFFLQVCTSLICVTRRVLHPFVIYKYIYIYWFMSSLEVKTLRQKYMYMVCGDD